MNISDENSEKQQKKKGLRPRQELFCQYYIIDWNATEAYRKAFGEHLKDTVCRSSSSRLLTRTNIQERIKELTADLEKAAGISKLKLILEHKKLAFNSIAHLHDTWITRKDFEKLTDEQKDCIAEIQTQVRTSMQDDEPVQVEFIKIRLFDKQKSLEQLARLMGYNRDELERLPDDQLDDLYNRLMQNKR